MRNKPTLVFAIASLYLLMDILLHLALEYSGASWLIEAGRLENMCGIDPVVLPPAHDMFFEVLAKLELVHRYL